MSRKKSCSPLFLTAGLFFVSFAFAQDAASAQAKENNPPSLNGIPGESIQEGGKFAPIKLDDYVDDPEDKPATLRWKITGNKDLVVTESNRVVTIKTPDQYWNGSEDLTFTVTDPKGASSSETVTFTVESVNNPPEVSKIPDQTVDEGKKFAPIKLDDFVKDPDHPKDQISWEYELTPIAKEQAEGELSVDISKDRIANVVIPDTNWYGAYKITFIATDAEYASDKTSANFTVRPVNDPPIVQKAPDQVINEKEQFEAINLSDLVSDVDDDISTIKWSVEGGKDLKVKIDKYNVAEIIIPNENWNGSAETFTFTATDPHGAKASFKTSFTVKSVNDPPEFVDQIPDQDIQEKSQFKPIELDKYVKDIDHKFEQLKWEFSGNKDLKVQLNGKVAKILIPNALWNGSETITFKVTDPEGASAETQANFTVESVNDPPKFIKQIPAQTIDEKKQFAKIKLDEFVKDEDHKNAELSWEVDVKSVGKEHPTGPLSVNIDDKHVATVEIPDTYWNGSAVATFKATDPEGAEASQEVKFTVRSINDLPVFKKIPDMAIDEKTEFDPIILDDFLSDADHDLSQLKIAVSGNKDLKINVDKNRMVTIKAPDINWNGSETVTFTATDPEGGKASTTVKLTVKSINDPPVMADIPDQTIREKEQFKPIELDKFVTDIDHAKNLLKWTITGNKDIKISLDPNRKATFTLPSKYWNGSEAVTFKVTDPEGASDERTVNFTVESVNDAPEFTKKLADQTIKEKELFKPINLGEIIKDPDHKLTDLSLDISVKAAPGSPKGTQPELQVNVDAKMVATVAIPNKYWNGSNVITFTVTDPEGAKATASATYTVISVNDPPVLKEIKSQTIEEKSQFAPINLAELANDPDHSFNKLKWTISGNKDLKVNIDKAGTATVVIPNQLWNGSENITFTVTDPEGASAKQTAVFTVKSVNDPPVMKDIPSQTIKEKQEFKPIELDNYVSDLDHPNAKLKWTITGNKELKYKLDPNRVLTVLTPNKYWHGSETFNLEVTDPEGAKDSRKVTFTVESINDAPEFVKKINNQSVDEKKPFAPIKLGEIVKDPDHKLSDLTWQFNVKPAPGAPKGYKTGLTVNVDAKTLVATVTTPNKYWNGADLIEFTVTDPEGAKATQSALFTVRSINDPPVLKKINDQIIMEKEEFKDINLAELVSDPDDAFKTLKWTITGNKDLKIAISKEGVATIKTPNKLWNGTEKVTFAVSDPAGASARQTVQFTAKSVNDPPVMKDIPSQTIKEKQEFKPIELDNYVSDLDHPNNKLKWTITGNKNLKFAMTADRKVTVTTPNKYWHGKETVTFTVVDPEGAKDSRSVNFEVISVNDPPVFVREIKDQTIDEKQQFVVIKLDDLIQDPDHKKTDLQWSFKISDASAKPAPVKAKGKKGKKAASEETASSSKSGLTVEIDNSHNARIVIPDKYWNGAAKISFTATDPEGASATSTALFTVRSINDLPVISDKAPTGETIREGGKFKTIDLSTLATDPDHPAKLLKWSFSGNRQLQVALNKDNTVQVKVPNSQWHGKETITFTVTDPEGGKATQQVLFEVTPVNDPPIIKAIPNQKIKEKERFEPIDLSRYVSDPDNRPNELKWNVSGNKNLKVEIRGSRMNVATPNEYWNGTETLVLTVSDPAGARASAKVTFTVTPVNDPPHFNKVPVQQIKEKEQFQPIDFSKFIVDPDNKPSEMRWTLDDGEPAKKDKRGRMGKAKRPTVKHPLAYDISDAGVLTVTIPNQYWNGKDKITVNAYDPSGEKASIDVNLIVIPVNDPPVLKKIPDMVTNEGTKFKPIKLDQYVTDPDNKPHELRWSVTGNRHLEVMITGGREAIVRPSRVDWYGKEAITFIAKDPAGATAKTTVNFEVKHVNAVPEIRPIRDVTMKEDANGGVLATLKLDQYVRDRDNSFSELKWTITGNKHLLVEHDKARNIVTIKQPRENWNGPAETITFKVTDPEGASAQTSAKFTIIPVNDPPVAMSQSYQTREGESLKVNAKDGLLNGAYDPDGKLNARVSLVRRPQNGKVVINEKDGSFVYTPNKGFYGLDEFGFKLTDKEGASSKVETAEINVNFKMKDIRGGAPVAEPKSSSSASDDKKKNNKRRRR